jgi:hydroxymethylpyrimidine/phosphomethylpyrimidine kinase
MKIGKALTIAGSDSGGGAGIQADLKTFAAFGVYGSSAITAITAQNTHQVRAIHAVPPQIVAEQIEAVLADIGADVIKTGMLVNGPIVQTVSEVLRGYSEIPLVVDPVMLAKSRDALLAKEAIDTLRDQLFPLARIVTPNIPEAEVLVGHSLKSETDLVGAAKAILDMGPRIVIIKGGHSREAREKDGCAQVVDLFYDGSDFRWVEGKFIDTLHTHGTGCTFSSAIAAGLAKGMEPYAAVLKAREYLTSALQAAFPIGHGRSPVHHFFHWWENYS